MNALLFSLPGTPVLYYGDEIGMGDNFYLGDRNGVRTPMSGAGPQRRLSRANPQAPLPAGDRRPRYHYESPHVRSAAEQRALAAVLDEAPDRAAQAAKAFGRWRISFLTPSNRKVLTVRAHLRRRTCFVVANLSRFRRVRRAGSFGVEGVVAVEMFGKKPFPPIGDLPYLLTLGPHSFYWFSLETPTGTDDARRGRGAEAPDTDAAPRRARGRACCRDEGRPELVARCAWSWRRPRLGSPPTLGSAPKLTLLDVVELAATGGEAAMVVLRAEAAAVSEIYVVRSPTPRVTRRHGCANTRHALIAEVEVTGKRDAAREILYDALEDPSIAAGAARRDGAPAPPTRRRRRGRADPDRRVPLAARRKRRRRDPVDAAAGVVPAGGRVRKRAWC